MNNSQTQDSAPARESQESWDLDDGPDEDTKEILEDVVEKENPPDEKVEPIYRTTWLPESVRAVLRGLKGRHDKLNSKAIAGFYLLLVGLPLLEAHPVVGDLQQKWDRAFKDNDAMVRGLLTDNDYRLPTELGVKKAKVNIRLDKGLAVRVANLAEGLGVPESTIVILGLLAGMTRSVRFVPKPYRESAATTVDHFFTWADSRLKQVRRVR